MKYLCMSVCHCVGITHHTLDPFLLRVSGLRRDMWALDLYVQAIWRRCLHFVSNAFVFLHCSTTLCQVVLSVHDANNAAFSTQ